MSKSAETRQLFQQQLDEANHSDIPPDLAAKTLALAKTAGWDLQKLSTSHPFLFQAGVVGLIDHYDNTHLSKREQQRKSNERIVRAVDMMVAETGCTYQDAFEWIANKGAIKQSDTAVKKAYHRTKK